MKKNIKFTVLLIVSTIANLTAQQLPLFSQYMFNTFLINPAAAGLDGHTSVNITAREQWLGLKESPKTHVLSGQTRLDANNFIIKMLNPHPDEKSSTPSGRVGLGATFYNDRVGLIDRTGFQFTYAYHLPLEEAELSLGLTASFYQYTMNRSKMILSDNDDQLIDNSDLSLFIPDFSFGAIYTTKDYFAGLSIMQLTQSSLQIGNSGTSNDYRMYRQYNIHGGYHIEISRDLMLQPTALIKISKTLRPQMDLGAKLFYRNDYWGGLSFRTGSAFIIMLGVSVDNYSFGYAFDYDFSSIRSHSFGSHEVMISIKFGKKAGKYRWLHRF
jgi:type IX secretion system PorP/SprF family membrane protein